MSKAPVEAAARPLEDRSRGAGRVVDCTRRRYYNATIAK